MKSITLLVFWIGLPILLSGQMIERQVLGMSGQLSETSQFSISATAGEQFTRTISSGDITITEGFQQPNKEDLTVSVVTPATNINYSVYPNPVKEVLNCFVEGENENITLLMTLENMNGKEVMDAVVIELPAIFTYYIRVNKLTPGVYILSLKSKEGTILDSRKIIKSG